MTEYIIEYLPDTTSIEREEVVRCRDCKHYGKGRRCAWSCRHVQPDGFCAWGERRQP